MMEREINFLPRSVLRQRATRIYLTRAGRLLQLANVLLLLVVVMLGVIYGVMMQLRGNLEEGQLVQTEATRDVQQEVRQVNQLLSKVDQRVMETTLWSPLLEGVLVAVPDGVILTSMSVSDEDSELVVVGVAASRSAVVEFETTLSRLDWVKQIEAPLKNFALEPEAEFTFSLFSQVIDGEGTVQK